MENEKHIEDIHSVEISINAKRQFSGKVKCYGNTPEEAMTRTTKLAAELEALIIEKNRTI